MTKEQIISIQPNLEAFSFTKGFTNNNFKLLVDVLLLKKNLLHDVLDATKRFFYYYSIKKTSKHHIYYPISSISIIAFNQRI